MLEVWSALLFLWLALPRGPLPSAPASYLWTHLLDPPPFPNLLKESANRQLLS